MLRNRPFPTGSEPSRQNRKRAVEARRQGGGREGKGRPGWKERRAGEDELRYTPRRIAESIRRVNYFIGTVRMSCGKVVRDSSNYPWKLKNPRCEPGTWGTRHILQKPWKEVQHRKRLDLSSGENFGSAFSPRDPRTYQPCVGEIFRHQ